MKTFNQFPKIFDREYASVRCEDGDLLWLCTVEKDDDLEPSDMDPYLTEEELQDYADEKWFYALMTISMFRNGYRYTIELPELDNHYFEINKHVAHDDVTAFANTILAKLRGE